MNNTNDITFLSINFIVSFLSDIGLQILAKPPISKYHNNKIILSLKDYFKGKGVIESGVYAGLTIVIALIIVMAISKHFFGFTIPSNNQEYFRYFALAFISGYIIDILIDEAKLFGNSLDKYYKEAGAGFWGAIAFIFSILISLMLLRLLK